MKRIVFAIGILTSLLLMGCNPADKTRIAELESSLDSLRAEAAEKDQTINEFFASLNDIEASLRLVKQKEQQIGAEVQNLQPDEIGQDKREQISQDIIELNEIMAQNRSTIATLQRKLKQSNLKVGEFEKMLASTAHKLAQRDSTIELLKGNLQMLHFSVDSLNLVVSNLDSTNQRLANRLDEQHERLNEAWYAFGSKKELMENNIITQTGGFLGIGKTSELRKDFDMSYFTRVAIESTDEILLFASPKGVDFVTPHPADSYTLERNDEGAIVKIVITDRERFWRASRFLVVVIK